MGLSCANKMAPSNSLSQRTLGWELGTKKTKQDTFKLPKWKRKKILNTEFNKEPVI